MFNSFSALARVVAEAQTRDSGNTTLGTMRLVTSVNRKVKGEYVEHPFYFTGVTFGKAAERLEKFHKGDLVVVSGTLECQSFKSRDGEEKQAFNLNISYIEAMPKTTGGSKKGGDDDDININFGDDMPL